MLRIVHLGKFYPPAPGGIETHLQTLATSQAKLGAQVRVICVNHADEHGRHVAFTRFRRTLTVAEHDGPVRVLRVGRLGSLARFDICPTLLRELRRALRRDVDIVHMHTPNPTMLIALAAISSQIPLFITHHSDVIRQRWLRHVVTPFERLEYGRAKRILSDSAQYVDGSTTLTRYRDKVTTLPLGIDLAPLLDPPAAAQDHARRLRAEFGSPLWLMVGRLIYYKGIDVALKALTNVPGRLLIIGAGPLEDSLRRLGSSLGVADRVVWWGHAGRDELIGAYRAATALWFPSTARSEGYGLVQVEAMASGCPVINSAVPHSGVAWVSPGGQTGLTVPMNDPAALAAAARRLLDEPGLREPLGQRGRERAAACFSQERMAAQSLEIYRAAGVCR